MAGFSRSPAKRKPSVRLYAGVEYALGGDFSETLLEWDDIVFHAR
jgi:hypothetical protein